jgi:hypothetical protein
MSTRTWRDAARDTIEAALRDGRSRGLVGADLIAAVDAAYPFGPRVNHPYQIWLSERRRVLEVHGLWPRRPGPRDEDQPLFPEVTP